MSAFTTSTALEPLPDGRWRLAAPLAWEIGRKGSGLVFTAPAGMTTDLASIPSFARVAFDRGDARIAKAAILHDAMLADTEWSRASAAAEFHGALLACGVAPWRAAVMALAVLAWAAACNVNGGKKGKTDGPG